MQCPSYRAIKSVGFPKILKEAYQLLHHLSYAIILAQYYSVSLDYLTGLSDKK